MIKSIITFSLIFSASFVSCQNNTKPAAATSTTMQNDKVIKTVTEWKQILTPEQYNILRQKGTEAPFTGKYNMTVDKGTYSCAGCGAELFTSDMKFDSHCGWPSFDKEIGDGSKIKKIKDVTHGMVRTEIICAKCEGHLGHIFDDGPTSTGNRYCVNSVSLQFVPADSTKKK